MSLKNNILTWQMFHLAKYNTRVIYSFCFYLICYCPIMGCGIHKSSKISLKKTDLIELQKHSQELNEKHMRILRWMENDLGLMTKINDHKKTNSKTIRENEPLSYWEEEWQREQELVKHPSMIDSCESKMPCITLIDENLQLGCHEDMDIFWKNLETADASN